MVKALVKRKPLGTPARASLQGSQGQVGPSKSTQRKPPAQPKPANRHRDPQPLTVEMLDTLRDALEGAIFGDFSQEQSGARIGGQIAIGFVPILGQLADIRDMIAAGKKIYDGEAGGWSDFGFATLGILPGLDGVKGLRKATTGMVPPSKVRQAIPKRPTPKGKAKARAHLLSTTVLADPDFHRRYFEARQIAIEILNKPGIKPEDMGYLATISDTKKFRREAHRIIYENKNHDLRFLLTEEDVFLAGGLKGIGMEQWVRHPELMEAGHLMSRKSIESGVSDYKEILALQTTARNRKHGAMERKLGEYVPAYIRIEIGEVPMGLESAVDLVMAKDGLTFDALKRARMILDRPLTKHLGTVLD